MAQYAAERAQSAAPAVANPAPLGLSGFALTTFVLSAVNTGLIPGKEAGVVIGLAIAYGGIAQFLAGMWEFRSGNTFGAAAFGSYGAFWIAVGIGLQTGTLVPGNTAFGYFLLAWAIFTGMMFLGTLRTNLATMGVFGFLFLTFLVLAIGDFAGSAGVTNFGGWLGFITAIIAWYTALAGVLASLPNPMFSLPTWPRS